MYSAYKLNKQGDNIQPRGQGSLACCSPWGHKESDTTERLNNNKVVRYVGERKKGRERKREETGELS